MQQACACTAGMNARVCAPPQKAEPKSKGCRDKRRIQHLSEERSGALVLCVPVLLHHLRAATKLASQEFKFCVACPVSITVRPVPYPGFLHLAIMLLV